MALDEFNKFGHPGNLKSVTSVAGGDSLHCTGSMYGVGAVMKVGSYDGTIHLSDGGSVAGTALTAGVVYNFSVLDITGGTAGSLYVFKTQKVS
jgi:hypothetical protein